jgi:hypothetical protein
MPIAPQPALDDADENDVLQPDDDSESAKSTAQLSTL